MLDRANARALPLLNRTADLAPAAQACCGLCRSCMTTNVFALVAGAAVALAAGVRRLAAGR
jgi:hypothetical protein